VSDDPEHDSPVINVASGWTNRQNGETVTQAFFVLEHEVAGVDNDDVRIELVEGGTPTLVEELWSEVDGNGTLTETSGNITTATDWAIHAVRHRYVSSSGMMDDVDMRIKRLVADIEFDGISGTVVEISASSAAALDALCFMAGEITIGGNPTWQTESDLTLTLSAGTEHSISARAEGRLDGGSDYATTNGLEGCYLHGAWEYSARADGKLDALCGSVVNSATVPDTTVVDYTLRLLDSTELLEEIELPCQRANVTSRNGRISRATFVVPDVDTHLPLLNTRLDGTLVLRATLTASDGIVENTDTIVQINIGEIETTREGSLSEITITGSKQRTFGAGKNWLIQTEGDSEEGEVSGQDFIRTLDDPRVRPGDFIDIRGASQVEIGEIQIELEGSGKRSMTLVPA
jgi:hypothetical protein